MELNMSDTESHVHTDGLTGWVIAARGIEDDRPFWEVLDCCVYTDRTEVLAKLTEWRDKEAKDPRTCKGIEFAVVYTTPVVEDEDDDGEPRYLRLTEVNDNEGETWNWWIRADGNERELDRLTEFLDQSGANEPMFSVDDDLLTADEVDLLVRYGDSGYFAQHTRIDGHVRLPEVLNDDFLDDLYKGGIQDFIRPVTLPEGGVQ